jgi:hypothetical protein
MKRKPHAGMPDEIRQWLLLRIATIEADKLRHNGPRTAAQLERARRELTDLLDKDAAVDGDFLSAVLNAGMYWGPSLFRNLHCTIRQLKASRQPYRIACLIAAEMNQSGASFHAARATVAEHLGISEGTMRRRIDKATFTSLCEA